MCVRVHMCMHVCAYAVNCQGQSSGLVILSTRKPIYLAVYPFVLFLQLSAKPHERLQSLPTSVPSTGAGSLATHIPPPQTRSPVLPNGSKKGHELFAYLSKLAREAVGKRCTGEEMGDLEDRHHPAQFATRSAPPDWKG